MKKAKGIPRVFSSILRKYERKFARINRQASGFPILNNIFDFMESDGYIRIEEEASISSKELYEIYKMWCDENSLVPLKARSFSDSLISAQGKYKIEHCNKVKNAAGRRVWGFSGIEAVISPHLNKFTDITDSDYFSEVFKKI